MKKHGMKKERRLWALLTLAALCLTIVLLAGCTSGEGEQTTAQIDDTSAETAETTAETTADTTETTVEVETAETTAEITETTVEETAETAAETAVETSEGTSEETVETTAETAETAAETAVETTEETSEETVETTAEATETDPPAPVYDMDLDALADLKLSDYFTRASGCKASTVEDPEEGTVLVLTTGKVTTPGTVTPVIYFKYQALARALGGGEDMTALSAERPYLVLKVKAQGLWMYTAQAVGCAATNDAGDSRPILRATLKETEEWQYICFDFSNYTTPIAMLRLTPEAAAGAAGETLYISEVHLCTAEEAVPYLVPDTYPIPERTEEEQKLTVLQFNIQTENGNGAPFQVRAELYRQLLDTLQPDSVGMEEVTTNWRHWLDTYVFNGSYVGVGEPRTPGSEACPIYYRADMYDLVDSGTFWLSDTPDEVGSMFENANYPRICTWVILRDKVTGWEYAHLNTHLDHNGKNTSSDGNVVRKEQIQVLLTFIQEKLGDRSMVLTGDFNSGRLTSAGKVYALYKYITGASSFETADGVNVTGPFGDTRFDAPDTVDENHTATMVKYYDESNSAYDPARQPIDYVFYTPKYMEALSYRTFIVNKDTAYVSDHLAVCCTYAVKTAAGD